DNQNPSENFGLEFRCNKFGQLDEPCLTDFNLLAGATVQNIQGANYINEEAANIFDNNICDNPTEHFTVGINANSIEKYYHNPNSGSLTLEPNCHNLGANVPFETTSTYGEATTCPAYAPAGPLQLYQKHSLSTAGFTDTNNLYYQKIDKGDFQLLAALVEDPNAESIDIRNELVQCSPYVSDIIWHKAINRTVPMNPWHLAQALLANSPLKQRVQQMVLQSGLSNYYKTLIMNGQYGGITTRDIYESDLMLLNRRVQESKRDFINYYMLEEEDDDVDRMGAIASMLDRSDRTDNLILAGLALWKGDFTEATNLLDDCPAIGGNTDHLCQVLSIVIEEKSNSDVCFTPAGLAALQAVATDESECGYAQARAWLAEYADEEYPQNIGSSSGIPRNLMIEEGIADVQLLSAQPNPSQGTVYLTYLLPEGIESCELEIIDSNGKLIEKRLATGKGIEEWNCKECPSGIYLIRMMAEGIELAITKVSIVK
ncbi:MAG: T9SS type A sorting domain-containing protein, partial [Pseudomonadota bacterium]